MRNDLGALIDSQGINITEMAKCLKVSRTSIYRVINGRTPSAELLLKLSHFFNKDAREIFFVKCVLQVEQSRSHSA
ncbi:helix-turn-helix transcriptional regulator [Paenibacillus sp. KR2-11]|uniref:helix-turn-helix transcriptional regulator n=1 Tax=Paenibacillus sp. KR2-11 TaxID=3385500 RepID=UPI0038FC5040